MKENDRILALIVLVLIILGSMFVLYNRRIISRNIEQETNLPEQTETTIIQSAEAF